jgi:hypothetical protein
MFKKEKEKEKEKEEKYSLIGEKGIVREEIK